MISFWVHDAGRHGIHNYRAGRGASIAERFEVVFYESLTTDLRVRRGAHVFAGLDQITPAQRAAVALVWDELTALQPGCALLNDPRVVLRRYDLLRKLHVEGINQFRVFRASDARAVTTFPVFLREASEHSANKTRLLYSSGELRKAIFVLRARGYDLGDLLVVEWCDTADAHGRFRKFGAFKVGDSIVPAHVMASSDWMVKSESNAITEELAREELAYVEQNPHEAWLRAIFEMAGIDFGRIDYAMRGEGPQVWEINVNPTLGRAPGQARRVPDGVAGRLREHSRELAHERLREAFRRLDPGGDLQLLPVTLPAEVVRRAQDEARRVRRRAATVERIRALQDHRLLRPVRFVYRRLAGRL